MLKALFSVGVFFPLALFAQQALNIDLLYHWKNDTLKPSVQHLNTYNEVWGFVQGSKEYAVIGSTWGTHILDVSDPANTTEVVSIQGEYSDTFVVHRDYHDYQGYLYMVCDEGGGISKLRIVDLSYLPDSAPTVYLSGALFSKSHNIFIDTAKAKLYTCGGNSNPGVRVFSLVNPIFPVEISTVSLNATSHDIYVRNDTAYINDGEDGLLIYNFSNAASPQLIGSLTSYPHQGYNHSGWLNANGSVYVLADETHGMDLKILDVSDLSNITVLDTINSQSVEPFIIPHNVMIKGAHAYVSYYFDGLVIFDISDPQNPFISGYYDTSTEVPTNNVYRGCWGVYSLLPSGTVLASDMQNGLYVLDASNATSIPEESDKNTGHTVIYPNPFNESFVISSSSIENKEQKYIVTNLEGKTIISGTLASSINYINMKNQLPGIYFVEILENNSSVVNKLIKLD